MQELRGMIPLLFIIGILFGIGYTVNYFETLYGFTSEKAVLDFLKTFILKYGLIVSFIGAFLEGLLLIGWYFPGSFIIFLTVILSGSPERAVLSVAVITLAMYSAYATNYVLGKHGWYRVLSKFGLEDMIHDAQRKLEKHTFKAFLFSFWQPGLASFTSTAAGVLQIPWKVFALYAFVALAGWNIFWGTLAYTFGETVIQTLFNRYVILSMASVWLLFKLYELWKDGALQNSTTDQPAETQISK